jgi:hypothetical protein
MFYPLLIHFNNIQGDSKDMNMNSGRIPQFFWGISFYGSLENFYVNF